MAGEMDRKELAELLCQVFFYDEDFLRAFDVGAKGFSREWREQTQVQVVDLLAFCFECFAGFIDRTAGGGDAYEEQVAFCIFMVDVEWVIAAGTPANLR